MGIEQRLHDYIAALVRNDVDAAAGHLSPDFGCHEGKSRTAYLHHELREFARRAALFNLADGIRIDVYQQEPCLHFAVRDAQGRLAYEDVVHLDAQGRLTGDGSRFEVVSKLCFSHADIRRACAIRGFGEAPALLRVNGRIPMGLEIAPGMDPEDNFHTCLFRLPDDDFRDHWVDLRIHSINAVPDQKRILLRGLDRPDFEDKLFPVIVGRQVHVPGSRMQPWALHVRLGHGEIVSVEAPERSLYTFAEHVVQAVLTDALDNDWIGVSGD